MQGAHRRRTVEKEISTRIEEKMIAETTRTMAKRATLFKKILMKLFM